MLNYELKDTNLKSKIFSSENDLTAKQAILTGACIDCADISATCQDCDSCEPSDQCSCQRVTQCTSCNDCEPSDECTSCNDCEPSDECTSCNDCDDCQTKCQRSCQACNTTCQYCNYCQDTCEKSCQVCDTNQSKCTKVSQSLTYHIGTCNIDVTKSETITSEIYYNLATYINKALTICEYTDTKLDESTSLENIILNNNLFNNIKTYVNKIANATISYYSNYKQVTTEDISTLVTALNNANIPETVPCCQNTSYQSCVTRQE